MNPRAALHQLAPSAMAGDIEAGNDFAVGTQHDAFPGVDSDQGVVNEVEALAQGMPR